MTNQVNEASSGTKKAVSAKRRFKVEINEKLCKGCYFCVEYCPRGVFARSDKIGDLGYNLAKVKASEECTGCMLCLMYCPDLAIAVEEEEMHNE